MRICAPTEQGIPHRTPCLHPRSQGVVSLRWPYPVHRVASLNAIGDRQHHLRWGIVPCSHGGWVKIFSRRRATQQLVKMYCYEAPNIAWSCFVDGNKEPVNRNSDSQRETEGERTERLAVEWRGGRDISRTAGGEALLVDLTPGDANYKTAGES